MHTSTVVVLYQKVVNILVSKCYLKKKKTNKNIILNTSLRALGKKRTIENQEEKNCLNLEPHFFVSFHILLHTYVRIQITHLKHKNLKNYHFPQNFLV